MRLILSILYIVLICGCAIINGPDAKLYPDKPDLAVDHYQWRINKRNEFKAPIIFKPVELYEDKKENERIQKLVTDLCRSIESKHNTGEELGQRLYSAYTISPDRETIKRNQSKGRSIYGDTILLCAVKNSKPLLVKYLLKIGVDKDLKDYTGSSAIDIAKNISRPSYLLLTGKTPVESNPKEIFAKYCKNGKQINMMSESFTAKLYRPISGTPLDKVTKSLQKQKNMVRNEVMNLYGQVMDYNKLPRRIAYENMECDEVNRTSILSECHGSDYLKEQRVKYSKYADEMESFNDFKLLAQNYAMKISPSDQVKYWGNPKDPNVFLYKFSNTCDTDRGGYMGYYDEVDQCIFTPSKLLNKMEISRLYENYGLRFTSVSETQSDDDEIQYTVQLNLKLFCETAIPVNSLVSI